MISEVNEYSEEIDEIFMDCEMESRVGVFYPGSYESGKDLVTTCTTFEEIIIEEEVIIVEEVVVVEEEIIIEEDEKDNDNAYINVSSTLQSINEGSETT